MEDIFFYYGNNCGFTNFEAHNKAILISVPLSWCLLAVVISILNATSALNALYVVLMMMCFVLFMFIVIRRVLSRLLDKENNPEGGVSQVGVVMILTTVFLAALCAELIGVHSIFGAFVTGIIVPRKHNLKILLTEKIEDLVAIVLLPVYFTLSGLKTNLGVMNNATSWLYFLLILSVCMCGKIGGCALASRMTKSSERVFYRGVLMNTKGLVELIILNIEYDSGILNLTIFSIMVLNAIVLTSFTSPLVGLLYPPIYYKTGTDSDDRERDYQTDVNRY
jgi:Kef-type K+ transport system membrane component KefB